MQLKIYFVDAFAGRRFEGNPAAVVPLEKRIPDELMQNIAAENNLSETAFFVPNGDAFDLRWFTPAVEVNLCGHATLASAHVLFRHLAYGQKIIRFNSKSGELRVSEDNGRLVLDFPAEPPVVCEMPPLLEKILGRRPVETLRGRDLIAVVDDEDFVKTFTPNISLILQLNVFALAITAPSKEYDFVSRFFAPREGIAEDPVTGSVHTELAPYWSKRLGMTKLMARQCSARGGTLYCEHKGDRVLIGGNAVTYLEGTIDI